METLNFCPICQSETVDTFSQIKDHFGQAEHFEVKECTTCTLRFTNPRPNEKEIVTYYKSNSYVSHGDSKGAVFDYIYSTLRQINLNYKLRLIRSYSSGDSLLDYGSGNGAFLSFMRKADFQVEGVEPDPEAREQVPANITVNANLDDLQHGIYDVITSYHVMEHVHQLNNTLSNLVDLLTNKGTIHIALPNHLSYDAKHYQTFWAGYDVPRHLYHFNQKSFNKLIERHQLSLVTVKPLKLDSYYVSLLSEQYKKSKFAPLKALWYGYRSNLRASRTGEYSSLVYILKKK